MSDAIAVFHPKDFEKLRPFLDLDDESEESEGLYAEVLEDGAVLVHTFQPYEVFAANPAEAFEWLEQFGDDLPEVHDDPRGLLLFPDSFEPKATTYDGVVAEMADKGFFVPTSLEILRETMPTTSFEIGQMFGDVQRRIGEAFGLPTKEEE